MGSEYFAKFEAPEISWHTRLLLSHANTQKTITRVRHQKGGQGIEVLIYTKDKNDIFYKTCHFFNEISCEISQAKIFTTNHSYALNIFNVTYEDESSLRFKDFFKYIEENLTNVIDQDVSQNSFNASNNLMKKSRQASFHQIEDFIELINDDGLFHLQIKTANRKALLLSVASLLKKYNISLSNAKITTMGERVEDHFDFKISNDSQFEPTNLENDLLNLLK
jgi:[protein-PII] uridylyltransferase